MIPGIDVSHWQGSIDWAKVKAAGIQFAYIKATEGARLVDPQLLNNVSGAKAAGIPYGLYHVFLPSLGLAQIGHWLSVSTVYEPQLPSWLDIEPGALTEDTEPEALEFLAACFQQTDCIYCAPSVASGLCDPDFQKYRLAIAHYTDLPKPNTGPWPTWDFWQHSQTGTVDGISTSVDLDWFNGDYYVGAFLATR
jgi:lysozyme